MCGDGKEVYRNAEPVRPPRSARELYQAAKDLWEKRNQELDADE